MSYSHLTITDRIKIETYLELGLKPCQIANKLGMANNRHSHLQNFLSIY